MLKKRVIIPKCVLEPNRMYLAVKINGIKA